MGRKNKKRLRRTKARVGGQALNRLYPPAINPINLVASASRKMYGHMGITGSAEDLFHAYIRACFVVGNGEEGRATGLGCAIVRELLRDGAPDVLFAFDQTTVEAVEDVKVTFTEDLMLQLPSFCEVRWPTRSRLGEYSLDPFYFFCLPWATAAKLGQRTLDKAGVEMELQPTKYEGHYVGVVYADTVGAPAAATATINGPNDVDNPLYSMKKYMLSGTVGEMYLKFIVYSTLDEHAVDGWPQEWMKQCPRHNPSVRTVKAPPEFTDRNVSMHYRRMHLRTYPRRQDGTRRPGLVKVRGCTVNKVTSVGTTFEEKKRNPST